jgi:phospholipase/carboxylesterase
VSDYLFREKPGQAGAPLFFVFHGTGGDENQFFALAEQLLPRAHVVAPRGDVSEGGALRYFRRTGEGVYDMDDLALRTAKMAAFIQSHVEAQKPTSVLGLGYSNGANILASTVFLQPELFDAAVLMHPLIPFEPDVKGSLAGKRILITAGRRDPICPPNLTSRLEAHLRSAGADVTLHWHEGGHELRQDEIEAARHFLALASA